jgi:hypothetical protein
MSFSDSIIFPNGLCLVESSGSTRDGGWNGADRASGIGMLQAADTPGCLEVGSDTAVGVDSAQAREGVSSTNGG